MLDLEQYQITGATAREIAASAEAGIRREALRAGDALPTVRALAERLGTSPATVNAAYRILRERGFVRADGRRGTRVAARPAVRAPTRERHEHAGDGLRDLSVGLPDPALLPPLRPALDSLALERSAAVDGFEFALPELLAFAQEWYRRDGVDPGAIAVVSGASDAIERVVSARLRPGDRVLVEDPGYPPIRDILLAAGLVEEPVAVDGRGMRPDALRAALARETQAMLVVPRSQNPTGAALDAERAAELREILDAHPRLFVIEDDHASEVAGTPFVGLSGPGRERWTVIRSMSKILNPDLRLAVMAGDEETVARVEGRQALGPRWVSHLLQGAAAAMLSDPGFAATCARATAVYAERRDALIAALATRDISVVGTSGLNLWVPVREEAPIVRALAQDGWLVQAGERFRLQTPPGVRITTTLLAPGEADAIAASIARVEHGGRRRGSY